MRTIVCSCGSCLATVARTLPNCSRAQTNKPSTSLRRCSRLTLTAESRLIRLWRILTWSVYTSKMMSRRASQSVTLTSISNCSVLRSLSTRSSSSRRSSCITARKLRMSTRRIWHSTLTAICTRAIPRSVCGLCTSRMPPFCPRTIPRAQPQKLLQRL